MVFNRHNFVSYRGKLVIIYMYLPSNWHVVAGSCVGATAMGIKEGVCQGVFVCAHEGICSLRIASEATSERLLRAARAGEVK